MDRLLFPASYANNIIMPQKELFSRISVTDCYIGLPAGEGFGYGIADSMMHGIPIIYVNYGGHVEYCNSAGLAVDVKCLYNSKNAYMRWAIADVEDASEKMLKIVNDKHTAITLGQNGIGIIKVVSRKKSGVVRNRSAAR